MGDQNQPGTLIQRVIHNQLLSIRHHTPLNMRLMTTPLNLRLITPLSLRLMTVVIVRLTSQPQSCLNSQLNNEVSVSDMVCHTGKTPSSSECAATTSQMGHLKKFKGIQAGEKRSTCSVCCKIYQSKGSFSCQMKLHLEGKHFSSLACQKTFQWQSKLVQHPHWGETI